MKNKDYKSYAPDKHGPQASARKRESREFILALMRKHGLTEAELYRVNPSRNRFHSEATK